MITNERKIQLNKVLMNAPGSNVQVLGMVIGKYVTW